MSASSLRVIALIVVLSLLGCAAIWLAFRPSPSPQAGRLELTFLPDTYCPSFALVATALVSDPNRIVDDAETPITSCRYIELSGLATGDQPQLVYVKLPLALAFSVRVDEPTSGATFSPILGDVNNDNVINETDLAIVDSAVFTADKMADIDGDGQVTVTDLSFVRLNKMAGVVRPDQKSWAEPEKLP